MPNEPITTTATTTTVAGIVGPTNATIVSANPLPVSYVVAAHPPTPRPNARDERFTLAPVDGLTALRALLRTPPLDED